MIQHLVAPIADPFVRCLLVLLWMACVRAATTHSAIYASRRMHCWTLSEHYQQYKKRNNYFHFHFQLISMSIASSHFAHAHNLHEYWKTKISKINIIPHHANIDNIKSVRICHRRLSDTHAQMVKKQKRQQLLPPPYLPLSQPIEIWTK